MNSKDIRNRFLSFFENRGHKIIPSASLIPENDPSVLFNTAGMQPLVPYLLGQKHPMGTRLVNIQKCVRTVDIEEVGDNRHLTFFEMMGNWSLGDYFKEESIKWSFEFLTSKEEGLGFDPTRLYVTVFEGDENAPRDEEASLIWQKYIPKERIYYLPAKNNWWSAGDNGPCGPDTEIFYDINNQKLGDLNHNEFIEADNSGKVVEIWNNVFMQYEKKDGVIMGKLAKNNVDTGTGLERISMISEGGKTVFETDLFDYIFKAIKLLEPTNYLETPARIIADHIRTAVFMIGDNIAPTNTDRGYILRRIIRRAVRFSDVIGLPKNSLRLLSKSVINKYSEIYPDLEIQLDRIQLEIEKEENKFRHTLEKGLKEFDKGTDPFILFTTYGFPIEMTEEIAKEKGIKINRENFNQKLKEHQELSRESSTQMFKGGLANHSERTIKLHTAHHLLLAALQEVVSKDIKQKGSNITEERLRLDFNFDKKLTEEEKQKVEDWVNEKIKLNLKMVRREMSLEEAVKIGAQMEFGAKYPEVVSVYFAQDENGRIYSKEFCGGPHVEEISSLGHFKIIKEEAVASGIRRIKADIL
jgi:alanyl-tRNA synthetase